MTALFSCLSTVKKLAAVSAAVLLSLAIFGGLTSFTLEAGQLTVLHALLEITGIILGSIVFFVAWYGTGAGHLRLIVGSLVVLSSVILSLVHLVSFLPANGLPGAIPGHIWIASWIFSRLVWSFGLLYSLSLPAKNCNGSCAPSARTMLYGTMVAIGGLVANIIISPDFWPYLYNIARPGHPLAIFGPFAACAANIASFVIVYRQPPDHVGNLPLTALFFGTLADLCFALGGHSSTSLNVAAHLFATLANLYILRTLHIAVIRQPYEEVISLKENMESMAENNARLYRESEEQRNLFEDILAKVGMIISSQLNLKETMDAIADMVADMMRARQSAIALYTEDRSALRVMATYGMNTPPDFIPLKNSIAGQVCETRSPVAVEDLLLHPEVFRPQMVFTSIRSLIAAPLVNEQEIIGVIEAYSSEKDAFTARDLLLLKALGYHAGAAVTSATLHEQTKARLDEEKFLYQIAQSAAATIDTDTILEQCLNQAARALDADFAVAYLAGDQSKASLIFKHAIGLGDRPEDLDLSLHPELAKIAKALAPAVISQEKSALLADAAGENPAGQVMVMPLPVNSRLLGLIILGWRRFMNPEGVRRTSFAALMAQQIALGLEKANLYNQVKAMALSDGLTGLANRRNFDMFLDTELRRAATLHRPASLIMLDIDKFKVYNDTYGHPTGDKLLAQLGEILRRTVRSIDFPARYGGEEFSVILPECDNAEASVLAEAIRQAVATAAFPGNDDQAAHITASLGVATYDPALGAKPPDPAKFIAVADSALYQAKQSGRNKVVSAPVLG